MSRSLRREKAEEQLRLLEDQFFRDLVTALQRCASGEWGMFGRNDNVIATQGKHLREMLKSDIAERLLAAGEEILRARKELGFTELFHPYKRYLDYRHMRGSNAPGEPKLAKEFLEELGVDENTD